MWKNLVPNNSLETFLMKLSLSNSPSSKNEVCFIFKNADQESTILFNGAGES